MCSRPLAHRHFHFVMKVIKKARSGNANFQLNFVVLVAKPKLANFSGVWKNMVQHSYTIQYIVLLTNIEILYSLNHEVYRAVAIYVLVQCALVHCTVLKRCYTYTRTGVHLHYSPPGSKS